MAFLLNDLNCLMAPLQLLLLMHSCVIHRNIYHWKADTVNKTKTDSEDDRTIFVKQLIMTTFVSFTVIFVNSSDNTVNREHATTRDCCPSINSILTYKLIQFLPFNPIATNLLSYNFLTKKQTFGTVRMIVSSPSIKTFGF